MITVTAQRSGRRHGREPDKTPIMLLGYDDARVITVAGTFNSCVMDAEPYEKIAAPMHHS